MRFRVVHSLWVADSEAYAGGEHEVEVTPENEPLFAGAVSAGVIEVLNGDLNVTAHVQSQEDGEAEYARAVEDGRWAEGHGAQAALDADAEVPK